MTHGLILLALCALLIPPTPETILVQLINEERLSAELPPLAQDWELARLARYRTDEMIRLQFFGHESPVYGTPSQMLTRFAIPFEHSGVNIAKGLDTCPRDALAGWLNSPTHRENLLNPDFTHAGVGFAENDGFYYWTIFLISSASSSASGVMGTALPFLRIDESIEASSSLCNAKSLRSSGSSTSFAAINCS